MYSDGFSDELLFLLTERPSYRIQFRQYCDSGVWFCIDANPNLHVQLTEVMSESWLDQIGHNNLKKSPSISSTEFWITESGLAHLKLLGALDFDQEDVSTETVTPVKLAP